MRLVFASRNQGKIAELRQLLAGTDWEVANLSAIGSVPEHVETGETFAENACLKARAVASVTRTWTLADDSGLEVDALGGEPGVQSARYGGPAATDADRNRQLLHRLVAVPDEERTARFRCAICLVDVAGDEHVFEAVCEGRIAHHARGHAGFGYDPIFVPEGFSRTFAELGLETKNRISHRAKAMAKVVEYLRSVSRAPVADKTGQP